MLLVAAYGDAINLSRYFFNALFKSGFLLEKADVDPVIE